MTWTCRAPEPGRRLIAPAVLHPEEGVERLRRRSEFWGLGAADRLIWVTVDQGPASLLEAVFASSPDAVVLVDGDGCIELASTAVRALFGYRPSELVGQPVEILVPDQVRDVHRGYRSEYARDGGSRPMGAGLRLHGRRRDGTVFPIDVSLSPLVFDRRVLTVAFVRDDD